LRFGRLWAAIAMLVASLLPVRAAVAHEIPRHVGVRAWVAPGSDRVRLLVQVPMDAIRDVDFPVLANDALDLSKAQPFLRDAAQLWIADALTLRDGATTLSAPRVMAVRVALPSDRAFSTYGGALAALANMPPVDVRSIPHGQLRLEVQLEVPVGARVRDLVIVPAWANLGVTTTTVLTLVNADGSERGYSFTGNPGEVRVNPRWWHAAGLFVIEGVKHMLGGFDHLLFLLCLVLPFRKFRPLLGIVTSFTVAHSLTLVASALGFAPDVGWFAPLVEVVIALSIVVMAVSNILGPQLEQRWLVAFVFGLVHGFGFSTALRDTLQFAGPHLLTSLLAFNIGVELAQVGVLLMLIPLLDTLLRRVPERPAVIVGSAFIAHEAWHWTGNRFAEFRAFDITMPAFDAAFVMTTIRVLMALLVLTGVAWVLGGVVARISKDPMSRRAAALLALTLGALMLSPRHSEAQARSTMAGVYTPEQATKGREVFTSNCLGCHTTASHQGTAFQLKWFGRPLYDLFDYVSQAMPKAAPGTLTEDEYVWVTAYILKLNGMPAGRTELNAEPAWLKSVRVDSTLGRGVGARPPQQFSTTQVGNRQVGIRQFGRSHDSRFRVRMENP
jgi:mono/diheme cytochrome c family protein